MAGRWIHRGLLDRLTARAQGSDPPSRHEVVQEFYRRAHWRNRKGDLCVSSANVCLNRLEKQGLVRLPTPTNYRRPEAKRILRDDKLALPPLPVRLGPLDSVRLSL